MAHEEVDSSAGLLYSPGRGFWEDCSHLLGVNCLQRVHDVAHAICGHLHRPPPVSTNGILYRTVDLVFWLFPTPIRLRGGPGIGFSPMSLAASWVISVTCDPVSQKVMHDLPASVLIRCVTSWTGGRLQMHRGRDCLRIALP